MDGEILRKFIYLFTTDASGVKKGSEEAERATKKLKTELSSTDFVTNKLNTSFAGFAKRAGGVALALVSLGSVIRGIKSSIATSQQLGNFSQFTGISVEDLSAYGYAVTKSGGNLQSFLTSVKSLSTDLVSLATKGRSNLLPFFKELGIQVIDSKGKIKPILELLPELAGAFEKIGKIESFGIGQKLGLDEGTINLLQKGRKEVEEIIRRERELGVFTKENSDLAKKFNDQWGNTKQIFAVLSSKLATTVLPILISFGKTVESIGKFMSQNATLIEGGLLIIAAAITAALIPAIVAMVIAFAPFLKIGAIIAVIGTAFALLYDDIQHFRRGQNSLIGEIIKQWPLVGQVIQGVTAAVSFLFDVFKALVKWIATGVSDPIKAWQEFKKTISTAFDALVEKLPWLRKIIDAVGDRFSAIVKMIKNEIQSIFAFIDGLISKIKGAIDAVVGGFRKAKEYVGLGKSDSAALGGTAQEKLSQAGASPFNSSAVSSITNASRSLTRNTSVNTGPITINTQATDGAGVAQELGGSLEKEIRQAIDYATDGVAA